MVVTITEKRLKYSVKDVLSSHLAQRIKRCFVYWKVFQFGRLLDLGSSDCGFNPVLPSIKILVLLLETKKMKTLSAN